MKTFILAWAAGIFIAWVLAHKLWQSQEKAQTVTITVSAEEAADFINSIIFDYSHSEDEVRNIVENCLSHVENCPTRNEVVDRVRAHLAKQAVGDFVREAKLEMFDKAVKELNVNFAILIAESVQLCWSYNERYSREDVTLSRSKAPRSA